MTLKDTPQQGQPEDHGLAAFKAHQLFPGRISVRIRDVAQALGITEQQVVDLIEEYRDTDGETGLAAVNVASGLQSHLNPRGSKTPRCHWRIPIAAFDAFVNARKNNQPVPISRRPT
jgi:hypothetical protein